MSPGLLTATFLLATAAAVAAETVSREEALKSAYPGATVRSEQLFLTASQQKQVASVAGSTPPGLVMRYIATTDGQVVGRAYVDTHTVRTKKESLLVMLDASARVKRIEVTAFLEPAEYYAPQAWLRQYQDRTLGPDLALNRAIRPIAGATLTARATNNAVRRVLAIDQAVQTIPPGSPR